MVSETISFLESQFGALSVKNEPKYERTAFGKDMLKHFLFDPTYKNMNHGSFGAFPRAIRDKQREISDACEAAPDPFIRYTYPKLVDNAREAIAEVLNCPPSTVVFVANATTGVNCVLRNIVWNKDGKDEILYFKHIYGACLKTVEYVCEANHYVVNPRELVVTYPMEDSDLLFMFKDAIKASRAEGKTPRIAIFDTVSSLPGLRMPWEDLTAICKEEGILSVVDGAHGVGHIHIDLSATDPDFFVSNAHKWLFVPRGCAVFSVPERNQHLIRTSLPTSHGFVTKTASPIRNPLPPNNRPDYINQFMFIGTIDYSNYLVIPESIKWREEVCGGEKAIREYNTTLTQKGGQVVAKILGTKVLDTKNGSLTNCTLINVLLPLVASSVEVEGKNTVKPELSSKATEWMQEALIEDHKTFMAIFIFQDQWWARLSGQVYLDLEDFEWAGRALKDVCERVGKEEFVKVGKELGDKGNLQFESAKPQVKA